MSKKRVSSSEIISSEASSFKVPRKEDALSENNNDQKLLSAIISPEPDLSLIKSLIQSSEINYSDYRLDYDNTGHKISILHLAAFKGRAEVLNLLMNELNIRDIPHDNGSVSIHFAAKGNNIECLGYLIDKDSTLVNIKNNNWHTPLFIAAAEGHAEAIKVLAASGADVNSPISEGDEKGFTPIYIAALNGHAEAIEVLAASGADVNSSLSEGDEKGLAPIHIAALNGHAEAIKILVASGADVNSPISEGDEKGFTPIYIAALNGHAEAIKVLAASGADVNSSLSEGDEKGFTPIHIAALNGHAEAIKILVASGADVNSSLSEGDEKGSTPIYIAAAEGHAAVVKFLLKNGCAATSLQNIRVTDEIQELVKISNAAKSISALENIREGASLESLNTNKDFVCEVLKGLWIKYGIPRDNLDSYKDAFVKIYEKHLSAVLLDSVKTFIDKEKTACDEMIEITDAALLNYMFGISPTPYRIYAAQGYKHNLDDSNEGVSLSFGKEDEKYKEFFDKEENAKYKKAGTCMRELIQNEGKVNLLALTEILLRVDLLDEEIARGEAKSDLSQINPLAQVKKTVLELGSNIILPQDMQKALQVVIKQYKEYKNNANTKTIISCHDKIELQQNEITSLKQEAESLKQEAESLKQEMGSLKEQNLAQEQKISALSNLIKLIGEHVGVDVSSISDNYSLPQDHDVHVTGSHSHTDSFNSESL